MSSKVSNAKPAAAAQPKGMSSRLLTMKFMQRATVQKSSKSAPGSDKSTSRNKPRTDYNALQEALKEEERIKEEALRKHDEITGVKDDGETRWELAVIAPTTAKQNLSVISMGEQALGEESEEEDSEDEEVSRGFGRMSFGQFNKEIEKLNGTSPDSDSDSDAEDKPVVKEVSLKNLTSISGGQSTGKPMGQNRKDDRKCFTCNESGHLSIDCPERNKQQKSLKRARSNGDFLTLREEGGKRRKSKP